MSVRQGKELGAMQKSWDLHDSNAHLCMYFHSEYKHQCKQWWWAKSKTPGLYPTCTGARSVEKQGISCVSSCVLCVVCLRKWESCSAPSSEGHRLDAVRRGGRPKLDLPIFKCAVIFLSVFLLDFSAFMQKQLRIWKARRWNILALAVSKFCRDPAEVYLCNLYKKKYIA